MEDIFKEENIRSILKNFGKIPGGNIRRKFISSIIHNQPEIKHFNIYKTDLGVNFLKV